VYSRLSFVQKEIDEVIRFQLDQTQFFNVESFSSSANLWSRGLQPTNPTTITSAVTYTARLSAGGSTNTAAAMSAAFAQDNVKGIYFLSDGVPDDPTSAMNVIVSLEARTKIPIYATALSADAGGKVFMQKVAQVSGGVYREINGN
jgi:hypothetical protein